MTVGQQVTKFTWLLDNVEVKGIVKSWDNGNRLPDGAEVGTRDSFDVEPDENYRHLVSYVPGFGPWVQCETYPLDPNVDAINRVEPWFLPKKPDTFVVRDPTTGQQPPLKVGDHVRFVGRWVIDHHPENCFTRMRGWLKVGCVHVEFHPFRWDNISLVKDRNPWEFEEETVSVAAPLHTEVYLGGGKWLANEIAGVASKIFIADDPAEGPGSNYHNTVTASAHIKAPKLPGGFTPHRSLIGLQEEVLINGTGQAITQIRSLETVDDGLKVTATVNAPRTMRFDNLLVADVNDPARLRSIFQARYRVWWESRLVFLDPRSLPDRPEALSRLEVGPQAAGSATRFEVFVKNRGPDPLQITSVSLIDNPQQAFQIDPIPSGITLAPNMALDLHGTFTPPSAGVYDGTLVVTSNDLTTQGRISIRMTGIGGWQDVGHANSVVALTAMQGKLYCATTANELWMRDPVPSNVNWTRIGHANGLRAMTALGGKLYCATNDNVLWMREAEPFDVAWTRIGHANNVVGLAGVAGRLYCATTDNNLWMRDPVPSDINWTRIGHANNVVAMTATDAALLCVTQDGQLWRREPVPNDVPWQAIGQAPGSAAVTGLAILDGHLWATTADNWLWRHPV
jgi:hypothetical protein